MPCTHRPPSGLGPAADDASSGECFMMPRERKKYGWPVTASLLVHSLIVGAAAYSITLEPHNIPESMRVAIVESISDGPGESIPVQQASSDANRPSQTSLTGHAGSRPPVEKREPVPE